MNDMEAELTVAENYLSEMLAADHADDYEAFIKRFDPDDLEGFNAEVFHNDVRFMRDDLGAYKTRDYLGALKGFIDDKHPESVRFVWRATYEKNQALIIVGIHKINGVWYINESTVSK